MLSLPSQDISLGPGMQLCWCQPMHGAYQHLVTEPSNRLLRNCGTVFRWRSETFRALSIRRKILEIPGWGANGTDISWHLFRNFGCTVRGWPKIPEFRNNRKIPFHSTIPARALFLRAWKSKFNMADSQASKNNTGPLPDKRLKYLTATLLQWISLTSFSE